MLRYQQDLKLQLQDTQEIIHGGNKINLKRKLYKMQYLSNSPRAWGEPISWNYIENLTSNHGIYFFQYFTESAVELADKLIE